MTGSWGTFTEGADGRRRALGWLAVVIALCLVAVSLTAYLKFRSVWDSINRVNVVGLGRQPPKFNNALNILLIGSDSRAGANRKFGAGITGQRSDTIIVLHIAPGGRNAIVLSIPRDSVVPILACRPEAGSPGQAAQPGQVEQINATFANGGPGCLWKTLEQTTHLHIDHFIQLSFTGFEHVINDVGGVNICLPFPINDRLSKLHLSRGRHHVWGAEALAFWRARYIGEGSDLERIRRDQFLMASVLQGVERSNLLSSPSKLIAVITDAARSMTTDAGLSMSTLVSIVESLRGLQSRSVQFLELPTVAYQPDPNWVTWPGSDAALFAAIAHDRAIQKTARHRAASATPLADSVSKDVSVQVLNGAGIVGLTQQASRAISRSGFRVAAAGDAPSFTHQLSLIEYSSGADRSSAAQLRRVLRGGLLRLNRGLRAGTITVIIGADFAAVSHPSAVIARVSHDRSPASLAHTYGGISGSANVCHDTQAFTGPWGGT
jgi:LCP family protein required for cell wall assembly